MADEKQRLEKDLLFVDDLFLPDIEVHSKSNLPLEHSIEIGNVINDGIEEINRQLQKIFTDKI